jgi:hypothetical protein
MTKSDWTSIIIMGAGPIEYWWDTPEDPDRFNSPEAIAYRAWREVVADYFKDFKKGTLLYKPWTAFGGQWDERAQPLNDAMVRIADVVINMNPGVPAEGTDHEIALAKSLGKPVFACPPGTGLPHLLRQIREAVA